MVIAGGNMTLLASLSRAVPFTGVKQMRDEMDPEELKALVAAAEGVEDEADLAAHEEAKAAQGAERLSPEDSPEDLGRGQQA